MTEPIGNNNQTTNTQYQLDHLGRIKISSINEGPLFEYANQVDSNHNGVLENKELTDFLAKYGNPTDKDYQVYDVQTDENGNLKQKSFSFDDGTQVTYFYKDNKPNKCYWLYPSGVVNDMNLETGDVKKYEYDITDAEHKEYKLSDDNLLRTRRLGAEKPVPADRFAEFFMRLCTWDWDWGY